MNIQSQRLLWISVDTNQNYITITAKVSFDDEISEDTIKCQYLTNPETGKVMGCDFCGDVCYEDWCSFENLTLCIGMEVIDNSFGKRKRFFDEKVFYPLKIKAKSVFMVWFYDLGPLIVGKKIEKEFIL